MYMKFFLSIYMKFSLTQAPDPATNLTFNLTLSERKKEAFPAGHAVPPHLREDKLHCRWALIIEA